jgi:hypothetical protein
MKTHGNPSPTNVDLEKRQSADGSHFQKADNASLVFG